MNVCLNQPRHIEFGLTYGPLIAIVGMRDGRDTGRQVLLLSLNGRLAIWMWLLKSSREDNTLSLSLLWVNCIIAFLA